MRRELLIGCGNRRDKQIRGSQHIPSHWANLVTLDIDPACRPDVVADLNERLPFKDNTFDEIHAYDVLEHVGFQGDYKFFFRQFEDLWRVLKPGGFLCAVVPKQDSIWAWGDPGHTRVINPGHLSFLSQANYRTQVGKTSMTDYRRIYQGDFSIVEHSYRGESYAFVLRAEK